MKFFLYFLFSFVFLVEFSLGSSHFPLADDIDNAAAGPFTRVGQVPTNYWGIFNTDQGQWQHNQWLNIRSSSVQTLGPITLQAPAAPFSENEIIAVSDGAGGAGTGVYKYKVTPDGDYTMLGYPAGVFSAAPRTLSWIGNKLYALGEYFWISGVAIGRIAEFSGGAWRDGGLNFTADGVNLDGLKLFLGTPGFGPASDTYWLWDQTSGLKRVYYWDANTLAWVLSYTNGGSNPNCQIYQVNSFSAKISILGRDLIDNLGRLCHLMQLSGNPPIWTCYDNMVSFSSGTGMVDAIQTSVDTFFCISVTASDPNWNTLDTGNVYQVTVDFTGPFLNSTVTIIGDGGTFRNAGSTLSAPTNIWLVNGQVTVSGGFASYLHLPETTKSLQFTRNERWFTGMNGVARWKDGEWGPVFGGGCVIPIVNLYQMRGNSTSYLAWHGVQAPGLDCYNVQANQISVYGKSNKIKRWVTVGQGINPFASGDFVNQYFSQNYAYVVQIVGKVKGQKEKGIIVGGIFDKIGTQIMNSIAVINVEGIATPIGQGVLTAKNWVDPTKNFKTFTGTEIGTVRLIEFSDDRLFVFGKFSQSGTGVFLNNIGYYDFDDEIWVNMAGGISYEYDASILGVTSMLADGKKLYLGGTFQTIGQIEVNGIAMYDVKKNVWTSMNAGPAKTSDNFPFVVSINTITKFGGNIHVGGNFGNSDAFSSYNYVAKWSGGRWKKLGVVNHLANCEISGSCQYITSSPVWELYAYKGKLMARTATDTFAYDGASWQPLPQRFRAITGAGTKLMSQVGKHFVWVPRSGTATFNPSLDHGIVRSPATQSNVETPRMHGGFNAPPTWVSRAPALKPITQNLLLGLVAVVLGIIGP